MREASKTNEYEADECVVPEPHECPNGSPQFSHSGARGRIGGVNDDRFSLTNGTIEQALDCKALVRGEIFGSIIIDGLVLVLLERCALTSL